jgi:hypothetical protein
MAGRVQLWSCGGGRQSAGIAALIVQGRLPRPDAACMAALEWERQATYAYVNAYVRPALAALGVPFTYVSRKKYATVGLLSGADGRSLVLPVHKQNAGGPTRLPEYCSGEWKRAVLMRWAAEQPGWKARGVDCWMGITWDERQRRRAARRLWYQPVYPLLDVIPMDVAGCLAVVERAGWPEPPPSRCYHCPNQSDRRWAELTPEEWAAACDRDDWLRTIDPHAYLHRSRVPLRTVMLRTDDEPTLFGGGCQAGMCF